MAFYEIRSYTVVEKHRLIWPGLFTCEHPMLDWWAPVRCFSVDWTIFTTQWEEYHHWSFLWNSSLVWALNSLCRYSCIPISLYIGLVFLSTISWAIIFLCTFLCAILNRKYNKIRKNTKNMRCAYVHFKKLKMI